MRAAAALLLTGLIGLTSLMHGRVDQRRAELPAEQDIAVLPTPRTLEAMSLGYREALADLVWIRALVFAGEQLAQTDAAMVGRYVDGITTLAPRFHRPYLWGGITAIYGGSGRIDRPMVEQAARIYRAGLRQFPRSHQLLYALGMLLTHQVASTPGYDEHDKQALAAEGVEFIRRAAAHGADPLVRRYAATIITEHTTDKLAEQFLLGQLASTDDEEHRRLLRRKLSSLTGRDAVAEVERTRDAFFAELYRTAPYLPDALYAVIRPEPGPFGPPGPPGPPASEVSPP